jgi:hypothetical protein
MEISNSTLRLEPARGALGLRPDAGAECIAVRGDLNAEASESEAASRLNGT